jgi:hypothetical protein
VEFVVADIEVIDWPSSPIDSLIIAEDQKKAILAVAEELSSYPYSRSTDYFVFHEGNGLNVLLW